MVWRLEWRRGAPFEVDQDGEDPSGQHLRKSCSVQEAPPGTTSPASQLKTDRRTNGERYATWMACLPAVMLPASVTKTSDDTRRCQQQPRSYCSLTFACVSRSCTLQHPVSSHYVRRRRRARWTSTDPVPSRMQSGRAGGRTCSRRRRSGYNQCSVASHTHPHFSCTCPHFTHTSTLLTQTFTLHTHTFRLYTHGCCLRDKTAAPCLSPRRPLFAVSRAKILN